MKKYNKMFLSICVLTLATVQLAAVHQSSDAQMEPLASARQVKKHAKSRVEKGEKKHGEKKQMFSLKNGKCMKASKGKMTEAQCKKEKARRNKKESRK